MKIKYFMAMGIAAGLSLTACKKGCIDETAINYDESAKKDDGSCEFKQDVTLKFTQNFAGESVTVANFNDLKYTNENGEVLSLTKLQYSISDIRFYQANGDSIIVDMHHFVDVEDAATLTGKLSEKIPPGTYTGIGFNFGFTEADNISGAYPDLNLVSWSWPDMIGGGYHQLKMEGRYIDSNTDTVSFQYHNGSATKDMSGNFHANYFLVKLPGSNFELSGPAIIEIKMDIAEWFKSPNVWDLNTLYTMLMPNYDAQIMMTENGKTVFSLGAITQ